MPELPEVETTRRGIEPQLTGRQCTAVIVRDRRLRWPVSPRVSELRGETVLGVDRRAKYLLIRFTIRTLIIHLGMSGSLRVVNCSSPPRAHDHVDWVFDQETVLRLNDPRRFGSVHVSRKLSAHKLLKELGPEPLSSDFHSDYLAATCQGRRVAIKQHLMNAKIVVGVGNIYASEALFRAGIHPSRAAGRIAKSRLPGLVRAVKEVLQEAIIDGGTTLRDFTSDGRPGYFQQALNVYGREGEPCPSCSAPIKQRRLGQRATYYCPHCQR